MNIRKITDKIKRSVELNTLRNRLNLYFERKGYKADQPIYPPSIQDLWSSIPEVATKVEVVPFIEEINPITGVVTVGWNLFVLGTNRMFLGESSHMTVQDLVRGVDGNMNNMDFKAETTPAKVVDFVNRILGSVDGGKVYSANSIAPTKSVRNISGFQSPMGPGPASRPFVGPSASGSYYERNKPAS